MASMSMNKAIHGAFRRDLRRFREALSTFPNGDRRRAAQLGKAWWNFADQLDHHHHGEHEIAWPALRAVGVSADVLAEMDAEHEVMAAALADADKAMKSLATSASATDALTARDAISTLETATLAHLEHEESVLEPVYQEHRDAPEIKQMGREFGKVSPARGGRFFAWVLDGASPEERAGATGSIPGPVITIIGGVFGFPYRRSIAPTWR